MSASEVYSPGLEGIQKTTNIDVARAMIELIERELATAKGHQASRSRRNNRNI